MANQKDQKRKLLAIQRILFEKTDPRHPLTLGQIMEELAALDIDAERKSIYSCIAALRESGMDIQTTNKPRAAYFLAHRQMNYEELALLLNVIRSCPSITQAMRKRLVDRVKALASVGQQELLAGRIDVVTKRPRRCKLLYSNLSIIQIALKNRWQIYFGYYSVGIDGKLVGHKRNRKTLRYRSRKDDKWHRGDFYVMCTPVRLAFIAGYYYLVCWVSDDANIKGAFRVYRVDRMLEVHTAGDDRPAARNQTIASYDPSKYEDESFGMFFDEKGKQTMTLYIVDPTAEEQGYSWIMSAFYDKFGGDMSVTALSDTEARVRVKTVASPQFFGWLTQFGGRTRIEKPSKIAKQYVEEYLKPALEAYGTKDR